MKPHLEQLRVGMIGEWSHNSAVGFSVECLNIEECYVRLRLRRNLLEGRISFLALEAENNDDAVHNHNQTHNHKYAISDPIPPPPPSAPFYHTVLNFIDYLSTSLWPLLSFPLPLVAVTLSP